MSKIVFAIVAICLAQIVVARTVREAPKEAESGFTAVVNAAEETFTALNNAFLGVVNAESNADLVEKVQTKFKTFANDAEANLAKLNEEAKPLTGKASELFKSFTDKITEITEKLKKENPEFVEKNIRAFYDETEGLRTKLKTEGTQVSEKAQVLLKTMLDTAVTTAEEVKTQITAAITPTEKKN